MDLIYAKADVRERVLNELRQEYPIGTRVKLIEMNDPYRKMEDRLLGTVKSIDDAGTIHVAWDNGSSLGVVYGVDVIKKLDN